MISGDVCFCARSLQQHVSLPAALYDGTSYELPYSLPHLNDDQLQPLPSFRSISQNPAGTPNISNVIGSHDNVATQTTFGNQ